MALISISVRLYIFLLYYYVYIGILRMGYRYLIVISCEVKINTCMAKLAMWWVMFFFTVCVTRDHLYGSWVYLKFAFLTDE